MRKLLLILLAGTTALAQDGGAVYKTHCAVCHDSPSGRVPGSAALRTMSSTAILQSLNAGLMKTVAGGLTRGERSSVAGYLGSKTSPLAAALPSSASCPAQRQEPAKELSSVRWMGWGSDAENTRFANSEVAGLAAADVPKLKLLWAFSLGDGVTIHSQAAVAGEHVYASNLTGQVFSLDSRTGCIQWTFDGSNPVRSALVVGPAGREPKRNAVYFGDQAANVYSVDAATGKLRWEVHVSDHAAAVITGAPVLHSGVLYVPVSSYEELLATSPTYECCTFRGRVLALDAATGKTIWKTDTIADPALPTEKNKTGTQLHGPSGAAVWSAPTFDAKRKVIYVATGDNYSDPASGMSDAILCLDAATGKIVWSKQVTPQDVFNMGELAAGRDYDFGQPPILVDLPKGQRALVIGQKSGLVYALDPDKRGALLWQQRLGEGGNLGGIQWGSASDREKMYVAYSHLQLKQIGEPNVPTSLRFEVDPSVGGGLFALRLDSGRTVWKAEPVGCGDRKLCSPAQSAAVSAIPGVVFSGSEDGHLRAYSASTGEVIWDMDTAHEFKTVNGLAGRGGSLDAAGPVISHGILYVNSGYGQWGGTPGNVLLAFSVDGK